MYGPGAGQLPTNEGVFGVKGFLKVDDFIRRNLPIVALMLIGPLIFNAAWIMWWGLIWPKVDKMLSRMPLPVEVFYRPLFWPEKTYLMFFYIAVMAVLGLWATLCWILLQKFDLEAIISGNPLVQFIRSNVWRLRVYMVSILACTLLSAPILIGYGKLCLATLIIGMLLAYIPFSFFIARFMRVVLALTGVLATIQFALVFGPFIIERPFVVNDNFDVPEATLIKDSSGRLYAVDNTKYFNERTHLLGVPKYDPRTDSGMNHFSPRFPSLKVEYSPRLENFLKKHMNFVLAFVNSSGKMSDNWESGRGFPPLYFYDRTRGCLQVFGSIGIEDMNLLADIVSLERRSELMAFIDRNNSFFADFQSRRLTKEEAEFLKANWYEIFCSVQNRFFFHHSNYLLGPINEYDLGRSKDKINCQYGWVNLIVLHGILKSLGELNYGTYGRTLLCFYPLYWLIGGLMLWYVSRSWTIVVLSVAGYSATLGLWTPQLLFMAPGFNPFRHFFDLSIMALICLYAKGGHWSALLGIVFLTALSVCNDIFWGICIACSALLSLNLIWFSSMSREYKWPVIILNNLVMLIPIGLAIAVSIGIGFKNYMVPYYFKGIIGLLIDYGLLLFFMISIMAAYIYLLVRWKSIDEGVRIAIFFLLLYIQGCFIYYVWNSCIGHILTVAPYFLITVLIFLNSVFNLNRAFERYRRPVMGFLCLSTIGLLIGGMVFYQVQKYISIGVTKKWHVVHAWENPRAGFSSTMEEELFKEACEFIKRNTKDKGIYIFSKYDTFLPFLSGRYSAMKYPDLQGFLISPKERSDVLDQMRSEKPHVVFTDADIDRDIGMDMIALNEYFHKESILRFMRIRNIYETFNEIRGDYVLKDQCRLLKLWVRKDLTEDSCPK